MQDGNDDDEADPAGGAGADDAFAGSDEGEDPLAGLSSDDDADGEDIPNVVLAQFEKARTDCRRNETGRLDWVASGHMTTGAGCSACTEQLLFLWLQVSRTKTRVGTKWKCQLKNGIMHLNGRDVIFHKGNGEMQF
jgi:Transcription factor IIA, alpha/beta subunit